MHIEETMKLDFSDVLIRPKRSTLESRKDVKLVREMKLPYGQDIRCVPVMNSNMGTCGSFEIAHILLDHGCMATVHKFYTVQEWADYVEKISDVKNMFFPIGMNDEDMDRLERVNDATGGRIRMIMLDVANGYSQKFIDHVARVRERFPDFTIAAGNVVTAEMTEALIIAGADIVKIGIGNGSVCTTRLKAGVGYPQRS